MIENDVIVNKLKDEGISEKLGNGLTFETDDELNVWVESYKSGQPTKIKGLDEYTKDELKELGDKGENKFLQSLFDEIRTKAKPPPEKKDEDKKTDDVKPQWAIDLQDSFTKQQKTLDDNKLKDEAKENKAKAIKLIKAQKITEDEDINMVLLTLGSDLSEANIKTKSEEYTAFLTKKGIKHIPGASDAKPDEAIVAAAKDFTAKKLANNKKFKSKN
jgi:hypothetical protein